MYQWRSYCTRIAALAGLALLSFAAKADVLAFDRGLPTANINAGADRSNATFGFPGNTIITGDTFKLYEWEPGMDYTVTALRVWTADGADSTFDFSAWYSSLALYGGPSGSALTLLQSGAFTGGTALDNPDIKITPVTYADGSDYGGMERTYQLWQVDFTNLNWYVPANTLMNFGILGMTWNPDYFWVTHASNAALSGSPQQGADNLFLAWDGPNAVPIAWDSSNPDIWDKSSDINVEIFATPEPASLFLFGTALAGIATRFRRKRA